jgi:hypothetical protein
VNKRPTLSTAEIDQLRSRVVREGLAAVARDLRVQRLTLACAIAGLSQYPGSIALLRERLRVAA